MYYMLNILFMTFIKSDRNESNAGRNHVEKEGLKRWKMEFYSMPNFSVNVHHAPEVKCSLFLISKESLHSIFLYKINGIFTWTKNCIIMMSFSKIKKYKICRIWWNCCKVLENLLLFQSWNLHKYMLFRFLEVSFRYQQKCLLFNEIMLLCVLNSKCLH